MADDSSPASPSRLEDLYPNLNKNYENLTPDEVDHFLKNRWIKVENTMNRELVDQWMGDLWIRLGMDANDNSTWTTEYQHLLRHKEVPASEFFPEAWAKMLEISGGGIKVEPEQVDDTRETWYGDAFIVNLGTAEKASPDYEEVQFHNKQGWHIDDDFCRLFLDSQYIALTVLLCFSDIPENSGGNIYTTRGCSAQ